MHSDLIERLEALSGPDREVDAEIALATGWMQIKTDWFRPKSADIWHHKSELPRYTASIDAAMTLVSEGWYPQIGKLSAESWQANMGQANRGNGVNAYAAALAIALCIAALRARSADNG